MENKLIDNMDIKIKTEIDDELEENDKAKSHHLEQLCKFKEIQQERSLYTNIDIKSEIEVNYETLDMKEEDTSNNQLFESIFGINENQTPISSAGEEESCSKVESTSRSIPLMSKTYGRSIKKNYGKTLSCRYCNLCFDSEDELKSHLKTHNKKFKCAHCDYEGNLKSLLRSHMLIHNKIKLFKCSECNYGCNKREHLKRHMLNHKNVYLFKCFVCNYECNHKGNLKTHMLKHENVKLFKCSECNYECNQKRSLQLHMLQHGNAKLFKCSECNYRCNQKMHLRRHMLKHKNGKLFKCSEKGRLKQHILKYGTVRPIRIVRQILRSKYSEIYKTM